MVYLVRQRNQGKEEMVKSKTVARLLLLQASQRLGLAQILLNLVKEEEILVGDFMAAMCEAAKPEYEVNLLELLDSIDDAKYRKRKEDQIHRWSMGVSREVDNLFTPPTRRQTLMASAGAFLASAEALVESTK